MTQQHLDLSYKNTYSQTLISIILHALQGDSTLSIELNETEWSELFLLAYRHRLGNIIFPSIEKSLKSKVETRYLYTLWKKKCLEDILNYTKTIEESSDIFNDLVAHNIECILLKGYSCSILYPSPQRRQMADMDILVREGDFTRAGNQLIELGYTQKDVSDCEYEKTYVHPNRLKIELHHHLTFYEHLKDANSFIDYVWENKKLLIYSGHTYPVLSDDALLVYLVMHMAKHFLWSGMDLRLLTDLKLLIDSAGGNLDWKWVSDQWITLGVDAFAAYSLRLCDELLGLKFNPLKVDFDEHIYANMKESFFSNNKEGFYDRVYSRYLQDSNRQGNSKFRIVNIIFPTKSQLPRRYDYARKYGALLPIAWVHRWLVEVIEHPDRVVGLWKNKPNVEQVNKQIEMMNYFGLKK